MKPKCVEELTEVLTAARFHPTSDHQLVYATSKGTVSTVDTRISAICDYGRGSTRKLQSFGMDTFCADSFYSELISSISDIRYSTSDGRFIIARDYLSIKIWDSHMSNKPIKNIPVNNYLRPALTQLYESGRHISHLIQLHLHPLNYSFLNPIKPLILTFLTSHLFNFPRLYV